MRKFISIILPVLLLAACNFPHLTPAWGISPANSQKCSYKWATQPLPDLTEKVQAAVNAAGMRDVHATAEVYGENCIDSQTNQPVSFNALETDFHITAYVVDLTDKDELGDLLQKVLVILDVFPTGKIPGPQPGNINISFQTSSDRLNLMFTVTAERSARLQGLQGAALFEKLQNK